MVEIFYDAELSRGLAHQGKGSGGKGKAHHEGNRYQGIRALSQKSWRLKR